jgi:hypothetical protein
MHFLGRSRQIFERTFSLLVPMVLTVGAAIGDDRAEPSARRVVVTRARPVCVNPLPETLGTFQPTPYLMVRGNWPLGGGYSPLDIYGDQSMSLYGPTSPAREISAPVRTYVRGYDGTIYPGEATSFSAPNQPQLSPVIYPTPRNYYYGPRLNRTPPSWTKGTRWIDQQ